MNNKLIPTVLLCGFTISTIVGCVVTYNYPDQPHSYKLETDGCQVFVPPAEGSLPDVPTLSKAEAKDRNKSDDILVSKIKELRDYARERDSLWERAYLKYRRSCR